MVGARDGFWELQSGRVSLSWYVLSSLGEPFLETGAPGVEGAQNEGDPRKVPSVVPLPPASQLPGLHTSWRLGRSSHGVSATSGASEPAWDTARTWLRGLVFPTQAESIVQHRGRANVKTPDGPKGRSVKRRYKNAGVGGARSAERFGRWLGERRFFAGGCGCVGAAEAARSGLRLRSSVKGDGPNQADGAEVHWREGPPQAAGHESRPEERSLYRRGEEAASLQARHRGAPGDPSLPEVDGAAHPEAALPAVGAGDRPGFQNRPAVPERGHRRAAGGERGVPGGVVRRH